MKKRSSLLRASIFAVLCTAALSAAAQGVTARLPVAELGAGMYRIEVGPNAGERPLEVTVEVAD